MISDRSTGCFALSTIISPQEVCMDEHQEVCDTAEQALLRQHLEGQQVEMRSPENKWYAGERLGRDPTPDECAMHYIQHGGSEDYYKKHGWKRRL